MDSAIINNAHKVGVPGRNLVLETFGRVYVKIKDRYYELNFKNLINNSSETNSDPDIIIIDSNNDLNNMTYPGDGKVIITKDGYVYYTDNGDYNLIRFQNFGDSLELDGLIVNGQIVVNVDGSIPPFIVNSSILVENLNAQYLNGYTSSDFAIKNLSEWISGSWTFANVTTFNEQVVVYKDLYNSNTNTSLNFETSTLEIDNIVVREGITFPPGFWDDILLSDTPLINGVDGELWINRKIKIISVDDVNIDDYTYNNAVDIIDNSILWLNYDVEIDNDIWYQAFLSNYNDYINNDVTPLFRDFTDQTQIDAANTILSPYGVDIVNYLSITYGLYDPTTESKYLGSIINIQYELRNNYFPNYIGGNTIVRHQKQEIIVEGIVLSATDTSMDIRLNDSSYSISEDDYFVIVDHLTDPNNNGGVVLNANYNSYPTLDVIDSVKYNTIDLSKLIDNDNIKARLGRLDGLADDDVFGTMTGIGVYLKNNVFISNANISFGDGATIFNSDGSGQLAGGLFNWTANSLEIDGSLLIDGSVTGDKLDTAYLPLTGGILTGTLYTTNVYPFMDAVYSLGTQTLAYRQIYVGTVIGTYIGNNANSVSEVHSNKYFIGTVEKTNEINAINISGDGQSVLTNDGTYKTLSSIISNPLPAGYKFGTLFVQGYSGGMVVRIYDGVGTSTSDAGNLLYTNTSTTYSVTTTQTRVYQGDGSVSVSGFSGTIRTIFNNSGNAFTYGTADSNGFYPVHYWTIGYDGTTIYLRDVNNYYLTTAQYNFETFVPIIYQE